MYEYQLDAAGNYLYVRPGDYAPLMMGKTVAVAFDSKEGFLMKHGRPDLVNTWATTFRAKMAESMPEVAESLVVIEGPFPVEELNKIIQISGYIGLYYNQQVIQKGANIDTIV